MSGLPSSWSRVPLAEISSTPEQRNPEKAERFRYIDIASIDTERKLIAEARELTGANAPSRARKVVRAGDTLVSMTRPNLNAVAIVPADLDGHIASTGFDVLRPKGVDPRWLFYLVRTHQFVTEMSEAVQGALYPAVRSKDVRAFMAPLAPLDEQKRIGDAIDALLKRVDDCRDRLHRVPEILKQLRRSLLAAATSGRLTEGWRKKWHDRVWQRTSIQSIGEVGTGSTPLRSNGAFYAPSGIPWVTSAASGQLMVTCVREFVTQAAISAHRLRKYPVGTLVVALYGEGKTRGQVTELGIEATINQACAAIIVDERKARKDFVKLALLANYFRMRQLAEGGNQPNLNLKKIKEFPLLLPSLEEQQLIVDRAKAALAYVDRLEKQLDSAVKSINRLIPSVLARAFRGELDLVSTSTIEYQNKD